MNHPVHRNLFIISQEFTSSSLLVVMICHVSLTFFSGECWSDHRKAIGNCVGRFSQILGHFFKTKQYVNYSKDNQKMGDGWG